MLLPRRAETVSDALRLFAILFGLGLIAWALVPR